MTFSQRTILACVVLASALAARRAHAQTPPACLASYEEAQVQRKRHALRAAREAAIACAANTCPTALARECATWIGEIEQAMPTVVFVATASGAEVTDVRVSSQGKVLVDHLDGSATFVDPGPQVFVFERAGRTVERSLVVREGEKSRRVDVDFGMGRRRIPPAAWVFGGVALGAAGAGAFFELRGLSQKRDLDDAGCKPRCDAAAVDRMHRSLVTGDLLLVGAGVAAVAALTFAWTGRPPAQAQENQLAWYVAPGGLGVSGRF